MISIRLSLSLALFGFGAFPSAVAAQAPHPSRVPLQFDHLYDYEEISKALHDLARAYPELLTIQSIGIWGETILSAP